MTDLPLVYSSSRFVGLNAGAAVCLLLFTSILSLVSPVSEAFAATPSACFANFDSGGSVLRGTTYSSFEEYLGVRKRAATDALTQALTKRSFTILSLEQAKNVTDRN